MPPGVRSVTTSRVCSEDVRALQVKGLDPGYDGILRSSIAKNCRVHGRRICRRSLLWYRRSLRCHKGSRAPEASEIIVSPVTETGSVNPIIPAGHRPVLADSSAANYNVNVAEIFRCFRKNLRSCPGSLCRATDCRNSRNCKRSAFPWNKSDRGLCANHGW